MLTLLEFHQLSRLSQYRYVRHQCLHLATREEGSTVYQLYHAGHFFIEVAHRTYRQVTRIRTFNSTDHLDRYLSRINIGSLVSRDGRVLVSGRQRFANFPLYLWAALLLEAAGILALCHYGWGVF